MSSSRGSTLPRAQAARPPARANATSASRRAAAAFFTVASVCSKVAPVDVNRTRTRTPTDRTAALEAHAVAVAVLVVALVGVAEAGRHAGLAHDDHAGRAAVHAQPAAGA